MINREDSFFARTATYNYHALPNEAGSDSWLCFYVGWPYAWNWTKATNSSLRLSRWRRYYAEEMFLSTMRKVLPQGWITCVPSSSPIADEKRKLTMWISCREAIIKSYCCVELTYERSFYLNTTTITYFFLHILVICTSYLDLFRSCNNPIHEASRKMVTTFIG